MEVSKEVVSYVATGISSIVAWFVRIIWNRQEKLKDEVAVLKGELKANTQLDQQRFDQLKEELAEFKKDVKDGHQRIFDKLDKLAEKGA